MKKLLVALSIALLFCIQIPSAFAASSPEIPTPTAATFLAPTPTIIRKVEVFIKSRFPEHQFISSWITCDEGIYRMLGVPSSGFFSDNQRLDIYLYWDGRIIVIMDGSRVSISTMDKRWDEL